MLGCEAYIELAALLADGFLSGEEEAALRRHAASCPACQKRIEEYAAIGDALRGAAIEPPDTLVPGVMAKLSPAKKRAGVRRFIPHGIALAAACLAIIVLAVSDGDPLSWGRAAIMPEAADHLGTAVNDSAPARAPQAVAPEEDAGALETAIDDAESMAGSGSHSGSFDLLEALDEEPPPAEVDTAYGGIPDLTGGGTQSPAATPVPAKEPASTPEPPPAMTAAPAVTPPPAEDVPLSTPLPEPPVLPEISAGNEAGADRDAPNYEPAAPALEYVWADIFLSDPSEYALALVVALAPDNSVPEISRVEVGGGLTAHIAEYDGPVELEIIQSAAGGVLFGGTGEKYLVVFVQET